MTMTKSPSSSQYAKHSAFINHVNTSGQLISLHCNFITSLFKNKNNFGRSHNLMLKTTGYVSVPKHFRQNFRPSCCEWTLTRKQIWSSRRARLHRLSLAHVLKANNSSEIQFIVIWHQRENTAKEHLKYNQTQ